MGGGSVPLIPSIAERVRSGPERSRARRFLARRSATLDGEDRCETITEGRKEISSKSAYPLQSPNSQTLSYEIILWILAGIPLAALICICIASGENLQVKPRRAFLCQGSQYGTRTRSVVLALWHPRISRRLQDRRARGSSAGKMPRLETGTFSAQFFPCDGPERLLSTPQGSQSPSAIK